MKDRHRWLARRCLAIAGLCWMVQAQAAVRASLDRDHIMAGQAVTLSIVADGGSGKPDLAPLRKDFDLSGVSTGSQTTIVNGSMQSTLQWSVVMTPRHSGLIEIPPIAVGGDRTSLLRVQVDASAAGAAAAGAASPASGSVQERGAGKPGDPVYIESAIAQQHPYVGQSVVYTLRLYYSATLLDAALDLPNGDNGDLRQIGQDERGSQVVQGRRYDVLERHFLVQPEHSGSLHIPPPVFQGRAMADAGNPFDDDAGIGGMGVSNLRVVGSPLEVQVRPRPAQAADPWVPAQSIQLAIEPPASKPRAGEPFSLVVRESGAGVSAAQLPEIAPPVIPGAQVYPEPSSTEEHARAGSLQAVRSRRFAVVPGQAGPLRAPALVLPWWDVINDRPEIARAELPLLEVQPGAEVLAANGAAPAAAAATGAVDAGSATTESLRAWQLATVVLSILLLAAIAWGWRRGVVVAGDGEVDAVAGSPPVRGAPRLREALARGEPAAIVQVLCEAAPAPRPQHLHDVAQRLSDPAQRAAVLAFEANRWSTDGQPSPQALVQLRAAFAHAPRWALAERKGASGETLPPLYPD